MVIVDIRPDGERGGGGGIPTDAYFAVEEIKDVRFACPPLSICGTLRWETRAERC